jgi:hypothetical protein
MENVCVASFDPSIFSSRPLSDLSSFSTTRATIIYRDFPRLCTSHLALKVPIVLATAANIRKYAKVNCYPQDRAVYYDLHTRFYKLPETISSKEHIFEAIINREPTDAELVRYFKRCANIAKHQYTKPDTHRHQPKAKTITLGPGNFSDSEDEVSDNSDEEGFTHISPLSRKIDTPDFSPSDKYIDPARKTDLELDMEPWPNHSLFAVNNPASQGTSSISWVDLDSAEASLCQPASDYGTKKWGAHPWCKLDKSRNVSVRDKKYCNKIGCFRKQ